jgi:hypothetical protein
MIGAELGARKAAKPEFAIDRECQWPRVRFEEVRRHAETLHLG